MTSWRKAVSPLLLLVLLFAVTVGVASAQVTSSSPGGETPGSDVAQAEGEEGERGTINFLTPDEPFAEELAPGEGAILFAFDGTQGDIVTVTATQTSEGFDPFMVLMGPAGQVIAYDDDSGEEIFSSAIKDVTLPINGSYVVLVSDFSSVDRPPSEDGLKGTRTFEVMVTGNKAPIGDPNYSEDSVILFHGNIEVGGVTDGYSSPEEPVYYYFLSATQGDVIDIQIDEADFDTLMILFDRAGVRTHINDDDSERGGLESAIRGVEISETGSYLLFVTAYRFYTAADADTSFTGGTFTLSVSQASK